jgi:hypothetical protein
MTEPENASARWRQALEAWTIPREILARAPEDPWALPAAFFEDERKGRTISHERALEALDGGGDVLDVGAGRCAMSLPLRPPADRIVAVDGSAEMLENSPADVTVVGGWPEVASQVGQATVVICGHVLYNVPHLAPFIAALDQAAHRRVVIEITEAHPRTRDIERELWQHFWSLKRPTTPTWKDALEVIRETGIEPHVELWESSERGGLPELDDLVAWMRRTVCLDPSRDGEVRAIVQKYATNRNGRWRLSAQGRSLATIWWDVAS